MMGIMYSFVKLLILMLVLAFVLLVVLWYGQEKFVFQPDAPPNFHTPDKNPKPLQHPGQKGMDYQDKYIKTRDGVEIHAWLITQKGEKKKTAPTMMFFQGNAGNMGFRLGNLNYLYEIAGVNIMAVSYRGYGYSRGTPTEKGIFSDADAALNVLLQEPDIDRRKIFAYGESVGGAVAIDLAHRRHEIKALITENTFTSITDMCFHLFPLLKPFRFFVTMVQRIVMNSLGKIREIHTPILILSGSRDVLVPPDHADRLFEASPAKGKERWIVQGASHNDLAAFGGLDYFKKVSDFIERNLEDRVVDMTNDVDSANVARRQTAKTGVSDEL